MRLVDGPPADGACSETQFPLCLFLARVGFAQHPNWLADFQLALEGAPFAVLGVVFSGSHPPPLAGLNHVFLMSSETEVIWVDAALVIAGVQHLETVWDRTLVQLV